MNRPIPPYLKLRAGEVSDPLRPDIADLACLGELCQAFAEATGWPLRYVPEPEPTDDVDLLWSAPVNPGVGVTPGHLRIDFSGSSLSEETARSDWHAAQRMAGAVAELVNELVTARHALWQREAELAAGVPVTAHDDESGHLADRLEAALRAGAQAIGCDSAALYLLDDATSQLKLRACWGLPVSKLTLPARPLAEQMADLEALLGHAVALESPADMLGAWQSPESADAALCLPVSSPTVPLGTLWFFCQHQRAFSDEQTNMAEVVAGRIASDLERTALLQEQSSRADLEKQVSQARRTQEHQLPVAPPPLAGWNISGWADQAGPLGGAFYDWRMIDDSSLMVMLGDACEGGIEAALATAALRAALRADDGRLPDPDELLARANRILWESTAGGWWAGLWLGQLDLNKGRCDYVSAGRPTALWLRPDGWASLAKPGEPLGIEPAIRFERKQLIINPGESLFVCNRGITETSNQYGVPLGEIALSRALRNEMTAPPERMVELVRDLIDSQISQPIQRDRSILIVKRLPQ